MYFPPTEILKIAYFLQPWARRAHRNPHMGRERVFSEKKSPITSVKLFGMGKVSGITKKNFKIGTLEDFEKTYIFYVAMGEKPFSSGQKWFLK